MKYINKYIISAFVSIALLTSCESDVLDDNPYYMGNSADQIFVSAEKIKAAAVGMYDALQNKEFLGGRAQIYVDVRGMDVNPATYFGNITTFQPTSSDANTELAWQGAYKTVNECNLFLKGIEEAKSKKIITDAEYNGYAAEAKFIRSVVYFYTLNLWGQMYVKETKNLGVPLVLAPFDGGTAFTEAPKVKRSTVNECYAQIISDLEYAEANLKSSWDGDAYATRVRATVGAADAMLSRVYLYMGDNAKSVTYADKVIGKYSLDAALMKPFTTPEESTDVIFFVAMNKDDNPNTNNALGQHYGAKFRSDITVSQACLDLFSAADTRKASYIISYKGSNYCNKYQNGSADWAPVLRYAEVLLNKAEALVKKNNTVDANAIALLNQIHGRCDAGKVYLASDFATPQALLDEILLERRRELAFEGHSSFDLFRNKLGIAAGRGGATVAAIPYPSNYFALPIPSKDVEKAGEAVLSQNPGY